VCKAVNVFSILLDPLAAMSGALHSRPYGPRRALMLNAFKPLQERYGSSLISVNGTAHFELSIEGRIR
jgi:hypothetical protein